MRFRAELRRNSTAYRIWSAGRKSLGKISDVVFRRHGKDYVTDELNPDEVFVLTSNSMVHLSMVTDPVGQVLPINWSEPAPKPEPKKPVLEVVKDDPPKPAPSPTPAGRLADLLATPPSKRR